MNKPYIGYIIAALVCLHGFMSGWAVSGMETVFFAMLVSLFVYCVLNDKDIRVIYFLLLGIILTRHDGLLLIPVFIWCSRKEYNITVKTLLYCFFNIFIYYFVRFIYYGDIIPHVMQVKNAIPYYSANPHEILQYWMLYGSAILFGMIAVFRVKLYCREHTELFIYCFVVLGIYAFGIRADLVRYSVHLLPVITILFLWSYGKMHHSSKYHRQFIYAFIIILSLNTYLSLNKFRPFFFDYRPTQEARRQIGLHVRIGLSPDERIISGDIGMIAYTAINHKFIDMVGLTSEAKPSDAKYIADTITLDGKYPNLPGNHEILAIRGQKGKPYAIGLLRRGEDKP